MDGGNGGGRSADVDDEGRGFPGGEAVMFFFSKGLVRGQGVIPTLRGRHFAQASRRVRPNSPWRFRCPFPDFWLGSSLFLS